MWSYLLSDADKSGFLKAAKSMQSKSTNASAFLACLAANSDMREKSELFTAIAELVSDMDVAVRDGVVGPDGKFIAPANRHVFGKLVCIVSGTTSADTRLFSKDGNEPDDSELVHLRALNAVKQSRIDRLARIDALAGKGGQFYSSL